MAALCFQFFVSFVSWAVEVTQVLLCTQLNVLVIVH